MLKRISITGPESSGKSSLAKHLAEHYSTVWVYEFAVDYLSSHGEKYTLADIVSIAKGQLEFEESFANIAYKRLFCDTDFIVTKIWCKEVFNEVPEWIEKMSKKHVYDLYLLCAPDLPWEEAPFRENEHNREYLFELYLKEMVDNQFNYRIVKGFGEQRFKNAVNFVNELGG